MANEEDSSSVSEELDENLNSQELIENVLNICTKICRKKENLKEFVSSMHNENSINKTVLKRFQEIENDFKEGRKTKNELREQQKRLSDRIGEVDGKVEQLENALEYITSKEIQIKELHVAVTKFSEDDEKTDELVKLKYELHSLFSEIKIKFRQSKKIKLSLFTKFKPDDLIQSVKSWEKAAETTREVNRKVNELQKEIETRNTTIKKMEGELQEEKRKSKHHELELSRLTDDMKNEDSNRKEQAELINTFRSLLDESEKLARNLEDQNTNLNRIISGEKERVSELRNKLSDLQNQIENERKSNREMSLQYEHMKAEFLAVSAENEGYKRDMEMIRKELDAIRHIQDDVAEIEKVKKEDEDYIAELEEKLQISDRMLQEKYLETEKLHSDLFKNSEQVEELEKEISVMNENTKTLMGKLEIKDRESSELMEQLKDIQAALESEKLTKDEYIIKCELLERKLALMDFSVQGNDESDGKHKHDDMEKEIEDLKEQLEEERLRVAEKIALVEELEEQLIVSEEMREYEEDIKTKSIENIVQAEIENRKLVEIVEELKERLSEKDSGIEELIAHCAVEELKLREEIASLNNQLQVYKRDCVYKANIIERLRRKIESQRSGLEILNEEDEEESETDLLVKTAALERKLHEGRIKMMKYEQVLTELNKLCEEKEATIREKDYELSKKSAEDGKRIAELLQELESDKKNIIELDEQIENLEDILSLKEAMEKLEDDSEDRNVHEIEKELQEMKDDYAAKKIRRKDELIDEMRQFIEELRNQLIQEQDHTLKNEELISDLNDANTQYLKRIDQLQNKIKKLEEEACTQKDYIAKLTDKITEGQKLISELEGVADRERMRVATIEQLLLQDQQDYSKHLDSVKNLKVQVDCYHSNVGELRTKIDRIHQNINTSSEREPEFSKGTFLDLKGKIKAQKTIIRELKTSVSAVEEKNEDLDQEVQEQKGKNVEQDERIDQVLQKTLECEDLVEYMKVELELVRKRYRGLSGLSEEDHSEEARREVQPSLPLFSFQDDEKEIEGDDELEEEESDIVSSSEDQEETYRPSQSADKQEARQKEIIHQLVIFEKVFEKIFSEEDNRIGIVISKFEKVIQKNTELLMYLQNVRKTLSEARNENERKEEQIEQMKEEFLNLNEELDKTERNNERMKKALEEGEERIRQLSEVLNEEQVKGNTSQEKVIMQKLLEDQQYEINDLNRKLEDEMRLSNQLRESLSVEQLIKVEYEREMMVLKSKALEEQEISERLREELERETTARYTLEGRMNDFEEETQNRENIIDELQKALETERRCYSIVTDRLQADQEKLVELESYVKDADKLASNDKTLIDELRESIAKEEQQKREFLHKLGKFEKETSEKEEEIENLMNQLGSEKSKIEDIIGEINLEKMAKSAAEEKLKELEEHLSRDEQIFDELRRNIDSESAKNRELSELLDKEQERNAEIEEKARELEKQVLMDLELFDELKNTIEQERAHNRELDALLNEKISGFNNRDKLLSELDNELSELNALLKSEQIKNEELKEDLKKRSANEDVIADLQDMLKSQIMHSEDLENKAERLEKVNREQSEKMKVLEVALNRLKELSAQISKELSDDLQTSGEPMETHEITDFPDLNENYDYNVERDALRFKALLNSELKIKKNLALDVEDYKKKLVENDVLLSELNEMLKDKQKRVSEVEEAANIDRIEKEEIKKLMKDIEHELESKQNYADTLRVDLENLRCLYDEKVAVSAQKIEEARVLSEQIEVQEEKEQKFIKEFNENIEKMEKALIEKEAESEMLRNYFEEEQKLGKDRLEENQELKKKFFEMETKLKDSTDELTILLNENNEMKSSFQETKSRYEKQREILVDEIKEKTEKNDFNKNYINELQKQVEEISLSHRRPKDQIIDSAEKKTSSQDTKVHLKEIADEFDFLKEDLKQKEMEITKLRKALDENIEAPQQNTELQKEVECLKKLAEEHAVRAEKALSALEKSKLLRELFQTELDVKEFTLSHQNSGHNSLTSQNKPSDSFQGYLSKSDTTDGKKEFKPSEHQEKEILQLREKLANLTEANKRDKEENERILNEKKSEIEQQTKTTALIKNLYQALQYEVQREKVCLEVFPQDAAMADARILINDLKNQLQLLQDEIKSKAETVKDLKLYIDELKTKNDIDMCLLARKENIYRLLHVQLEEKEKKGKRIEGLLQSIEKIYDKNLTEDEEETENTLAEIDNKNDIDLQDEEDGANAEAAQVIRENFENPIIQPLFEQQEDANDSLVLPSKIAPKNETCKFLPLDSSCSSQAKEKAGIDDQDLPNSEWKLKLVLYCIIALGLSFLPIYFKLKSLRFVLVFIVTPLFFVLSTIEVKVYRKKVKNFFKRQLGIENLRDEPLVSKPPLIEGQIKIKMEEQEELFKFIQDELRQELETSKKNDPLGKDLDVEKQKRKIDDLEKKIQDFEKLNVEEQEKNRKSHDEYIKLRNDVDELKQRRNKESKLGSMELKKNDTSRFDNDLRLLSLRVRSLPLWIVFISMVYHVTSLHPAAPCAMFLLLSLYAVNSWFKIKTIKNKLLSEREIIREQNEELEDLTELLKKEQDVVEAQKAAMEILVKEMDNEYVSRKAKSLTLAKMIIQIKEVEEMRRAIQEENMPGDPELKVAIKSVSEERAEERMRMYLKMSQQLPDLKSSEKQEMIEDINETVEELAAHVAENESTGTSATRTNSKKKLVIMAILGSTAFVFSLIFSYYFPTILTAAQLVIIFLWLARRKPQDDQYPSNVVELQTRLHKEIQKNKANRQQIGKLKRLLDTEKSLQKSDECAKEIKQRVLNRAAKRKQ